MKFKPDRGGDGTIRGEPETATTKAKVAQDIEDQRKKGPTFEHRGK